MAKLMILYGHPKDPPAFEDYYANRFTVAGLANFATGGVTVLIVDDDE